MPDGMPNINGGASGAKNGDQFFDANASFGGLNYQSGVPHWVVGLGVIACLYLFMKK